MFEKPIFIKKCSISQQFSFQIVTYCQSFAAEKEKKLQKFICRTFHQNFLLHNIQYRVIQDPVTDKIRTRFYKLLDNISILSAAAGYTGVPFKRPNRKYTLNSSYD